MSICPCGYWWADLDEDGTPISLEYCHYEGPAEWAPCEQDGYDEYANEARIEEEAAYEEWLDEQDRIARQELEEESHNGFYGEPYDYAEF